MDRVLRVQPGALEVPDLAGKRDLLQAARPDVQRDDPHLLVDGVPAVEPPGFRLDPWVIHAVVNVVVPGDHMQGLVSSQPQDDPVRDRRGHQIAGRLERLQSSGVLKDPAKGVIGDKVEADVIAVQFPPGGHHEF